MMYAKFISIKHEGVANICTKGVDSTVDIQWNKVNNNLDTNIHLTTISGNTKPFKQQIFNICWSEISTECAIASNRYVYVVKNEHHKFYNTDQHKFTVIRKLNFKLYEILRYLTVNISSDIETTHMFSLDSNVYARWM